MNETVKSYLVYGNEIDNLLKIAFNFVEGGRFVWIISPEPIMRLPKTLIPPDKEVLKLLTFLYLKDSTDLLKHLNSIHTWYRTPELIIMNDFHKYTSLDSEDYSPIDGAYLCATFLDAGNACVKKLNKAAYLIASADLSKCTNKNNVQNLVNLYFDNVSSCSDINL